MVTASRVHFLGGSHRRGVGEPANRSPHHRKSTRGGAGLCLDIHDLAASKLVAGREKDLNFVAGLLRHRPANPETVRTRLTDLPLEASRRELGLARLQRLSPA